MLSGGEGCKQFLSLCEISRNQIKFFALLGNCALFDIIKGVVVLRFLVRYVKNLIPLCKISIFCKGTVLYCFQNRRKLRA